MITNKAFRINPGVCVGAYRSVWLTGIITSNISSQSKCLSVYLCVESYNVHHLMGIELQFAPPTCIVHHGAQGGLMSVRSGGRPRHFSFLMGHKENLGPSCAPWCTMQVGGAQCRSMVHKIALYQWSGAQQFPQTHTHRNRDETDSITWTADAGGKIKKKK